MSKTSVRSGGFQSKFSNLLNEGIMLWEYRIYLPIVENVQNFGKIWRFSVNLFQLLKRTYYALDMYNLISDDTKCPKLWQVLADFGQSFLDFYCLCMCLPCHGIYVK